MAVINFYTEKHLLEWTTRINSNSQDNEKLIQVFLDITKDYDCSESQKGCLLGNLAAEISAASNAQNLLDVDSTPDANSTNDGTPKATVIQPLRVPASS